MTGQPRQRPKMVVVTIFHLKRGRPWQVFSELSPVTRVGLDSEKNAFQLHCVDAKGEAVVNRAPGALFKIVPLLPHCLAAIEACSSALTGRDNWWRSGFEVRLMPPAQVKPYGRRKKNDAATAAAICEVASPARSAVRTDAFDQEPGRTDAPSGARAARRPAHFAAERVARAHGRDRPGRAPRPRIMCTILRAWSPRRLRRRRDRSPRLRRAWFARRLMRRSEDRQGACGVGQGRDGQAVDSS
jgi:hypothetical protein